MNFFNATWLFGLFSLFIPIILHLRKRKLKTIDWAAVRFLKTSIVNRRPGHTLEHFFLLMCRCLLLVAFIFLFARPWTNPGDSILFGFPWLLLFLGLGFVVTSITWTGPRLHRVLSGSIGCVLATLSLVFFVYRQETNSIAGNQSCDVVIVIDGSDSMGLRNETVTLGSSTLFSTAVKEAQQFLDNLPSGSTAAFIVVGDDTRPHRNQLKSNISLLRKQLESLTFPGGTNDLRIAIEHAKSILKSGANSRQQVLVLTDDQLTNWQSLNASEVSITHPVYDEEENSDKPHQHGLIAKVLNIPEKTINLAVTNIVIEDQTWRVGERARVDIEVFNGGTEPSDGTTIEFQFNDTLKQSISVEPMEPGTRRFIPTEIVWDHAGSASLGAKINSLDTVSQDNDFQRAFLIQNEIKVLVVEGENPDSEIPNAAHYVRLAMNSRQIKMESVPVRDLDGEFPIERFDIICLCNVPRLTNAAAERIARFAKNGGGLFVLLGEDCDSSFYNAWQCESTQVMPCALTKYLTKEASNATSIGLDWASVQHAALKPWFASGQHDLSDWKFEEYWIANPLNQQFLPDSYARLDYLNGHPFYIEHNLGQGRVVAQTSCPVPRSNNLINRISFPVWHHILNRYLAPKVSTGFHQRSTTTWVAQIPLMTDGEILLGQPSESNSTAILTNPLGLDRTVPIELDGRFWKVDLGDARYPGLYKLAGPFGKSFPTETWRLSIERDANESDLSKATEEQILPIA
ncbi:MAG: VWA domain-containing protein, partial [Pirellula sp.]|nr:VWA domain-containing protein [Pirellula sp.]